MLLESSSKVPSVVDENHIRIEWNVRHYKAERLSFIAYQNPLLKNFRAYQSNIFNRVFFCDLKTEHFFTVSIKPARFSHFLVIVPLIQSSVHVYYYV